MILTLTFRHNLLNWLYVGQLLEFSVHNPTKPPRLDVITRSMPIVKPIISEALKFRGGINKGGRI